MFGITPPEENEDGSAEVKVSSVALQLGLRKPPDIRVEEYYPTFLNMAKNFMEGGLQRQPHLRAFRKPFISK